MDSDAVHCGSIGHIARNVGSAGEGPVGGASSKTTNHPRRDVKSIESEAGGSQQAEKTRRLVAGDIMPFKTGGRTAAIKLSNARFAPVRRRRRTRAQKHSVFETSTISIRRRRDAEAALCGGMARGAAEERERLVEIRFRRSRHAELHPGIKAMRKRCSRPPRRRSSVLLRTSKINRSVDEGIGANMTAAKVGADSRLADPGVRCQSSSFHDAGDQYPRSARGALGGAVFGHEEERGEVVAQSLDS
ncbi:hypothetical protein GGR51DRAFT_554889 [Nemania sp. FL0031]|nr:hypothetical protein GGR51DRAFT_554889 [Nemania sp. FL0031]